MLDIYYRKIKNIEKIEYIENIKKIGYFQKYHNIFQPCP